ncbi:hypothetical protein JZ751_021640, partial [Albula glossodonta]
MPGEEVHQRRGSGRSKKAKLKGKGQQDGSALDNLGSTDGQEDQSCPEQSPALSQKKAVKAKLEEESFSAILLQVLLPYLLAGMGMVMAGMVLDSVQ